MTDLSDQQTAILTEGICPLCERELQATIVPNFWRCSHCEKGFQLTSVLDTAPTCYTEWDCPHCDRSNFSVHPAYTHDLECGHCGKVTTLTLDP